MANKTLPNLSTLTASLATYVAAANSDGVLGKITLNALKALVSVTSSLAVTTAIPSTNPGAVTGGRMWVASTPGTYTNFAGIVIGSAEAAFIVDTGVAYSKVTIPIDLAGYVTAASVVDNLTSSSVTAPLSANQGRLLAAMVPTFVGTPGKNLHNPAADITGQIISYVNGTLSATANSQVSDFMPVLPSTTYTISGRITSSGTRGVSYYDAAKVLINTPTGPTTWGDGALNGQYTTTAATAFMRITTKFSGTGDPALVQVEKGNVATAFESYYTVIENVAGISIAAAKLDTSIGILAPDAWATAKGFSAVGTSVIPQSVNLFNLATVTTGFHINNATGLLTAQAGSSTSDFIAVSPSTAYYISGRVTSSGTHGVSYYDATQTFINTPTGPTTWGDGPVNGVYTTTSGTAFMRITTQFAGTGTLATIQVEKGSQPTTYVAFSSFNAITSVNGSPVYANDAKIIEKVQIMIANRWTGKKICWVGTSIPAGYPDADKSKSYPNIAAGRLGATMINEALASSLVRIATSTGGALGSPYDSVSFGKTGAELSAGGFASANSYETKLLSHLDADLYVFDFGYNDFSVDSTNFATMPGSPTDRNTFIGATNYCIYKLLEAKPKARFAFFGHYENQFRPLIASAQQVIADYWQAYMFKTWERTNWSTKLVPPANTTSVRATWLTDGIHPNSDTTGAATALLANLAEAFLKSL